MVPPGTIFFAGRHRRTGNDCENWIWHRSETGSWAGNENLGYMAKKQAPVA